MLGGFASRDSSVVWLGGGLLAWWVAYAFVIAPRSMWARCEHGPQEYIFAADGIRGTMPNASARYDWDFWTEVIETPSAYVLRSQRGYVLVPRRAFETLDDEAKFGRLALNARSFG
jgi:hypothetical protein